MALNSTGSRSAVPCCTCLVIALGLTAFYPAMASAQDPTSATTTTTTTVATTATPVLTATAPRPRVINKLTGETQGFYFDLSWPAYLGATQYWIYYYKDAAGTVREPSIPSTMTTALRSRVIAVDIPVLYSRVVVLGASGTLNQSNLVRSDFSVAPVVTVAPVTPPAPTWTLLNGNARDVGLGGSEMWAVGTNVATYGYGVYRWINSGWSAVASTGATRIDVDATGIPWAVDNRGYLSKFQAGAWVSVKASSVVDVGVGANGVAWMIGGVADAAGNFGIFRQDSADLKVGWIKVSGGAVRVDVDPQGTPWVVNSAGAVYRWNGMAWTQLAGVVARDVGIGADGSAFATGTDNFVYRWSGTAWVKRDGTGNSISVDATGVPVMVNAAGSIYKGWK